MMTRILAILTMILLPAAVSAQSNPLEPGWSLQPSASSIRIQSVKKQTVVESSSFATYTGQIAPDGTLGLTIALDSIDTKIDLRNVRMRFLFFETFRYPEAKVTAHIDPAVIDSLGRLRRVTFSQPFTLDLHGVSHEYTADLVATLITDDLVSVATLAPVSVPAAEHNLSEGIAKLEEAAQVTLVPSGSVTFDFLFARDGAAAPGQTADAAAPAPAPAAEAPAPAKSAALEAQGNFDTEACLGRFEILSKTGNIFFAPASARLNSDSTYVLDQLYDIVSRCPGMVVEIGGHTDSDGSDATNQQLSERRAAAVETYLVSKGIPAGRLVVKGYGESQPFVPNDSAAHKARNRRIEFKVVG